MENGRVVELDLNGVGLTGAIPAEIGQLTSLETLYIQCNRLTRLPAEIGQLTSLSKLWLDGNRLTSLAAAIRELREAGCYVCYVYLRDGETVDECCRTSQGGLVV